MSRRPWLGSSQDEVVPVWTVSLLGTRVTAQLRRNRSEVDSRNALSVCEVTDSALPRLHGLPLRKLVRIPAPRRKPLTARGSWATPGIHSDTAVG